ncbi:MAG: Ig-like domain-containing protein [Gemmatimonadetes bacterium]|nr:Ig-like domain-containing protein [Gemmatimonadota bacterium]
MTHRFAAGGRAPRRLWVGVLLTLAACGGGGSGDAGSIGGLATVTGGPKVLSRVLVIMPATTMLVGETMTATAAGFDQHGAPIAIGPPAWSTSAPDIATATAAGAVSGLAPGTTSVIATVDGQHGEVVLGVLPVPISRVTLSPALLPLAVGQLQPLTATVVDVRGNVVTGHPIAWSSSAPSVATVSATGVVTAAAAGTATVTATCDGVAQTALVTVTLRLASVASISVTPAASALSMGRTSPLVAELRDSSGAVVTGRAIGWSTDAPAVATVNPTGVVTAVAPGTATISATSEGHSAAATVTVTNDVVVELVNPQTTTVSGDTVFVAAIVKAARPLASVFADVGRHHVQLLLIHIGALGGVPAWGAHIDISDAYWGPTTVTVTATDASGSTGSGSVRFTYNPSHVTGGIIPPTKDRALVPAVRKRIP